MSKKQNIWPDCEADGYFDRDGRLRVGYVIRERLEEIFQLTNEKVSASQVRRYFQHCRSIEQRMRSGESWECLESVFRKLDISAADALAKRKIPSWFHEFIRKNVAAVKSRKDFAEGFMPHFEALVGFGSKFFDPNKG